MTRQVSLPLGNTWGGARLGAGRKPARGRAGVPHVCRPVHSCHHPLHVTVRVRQGLPSLREQALFFCIEKQIRAAKRRFLRIVHFSVQSNHLHLLVEAADCQQLARGMKGFGVRVARRLNHLLSARGNVYDDRYHARVLKTPREVRNALVYVLFNYKKHRRRAAVLLDPRSSARYFDGWSHRSPVPAARGAPDDWPVAQSRTWLLTRGWRRLGGGLEQDESPR